MIIDLKHSEHRRFKSFYSLSTFQWGNREVYIIGGDAVLHKLIVQFLTAQENFILSVQLAHSLYTEIPGHYALVILQDQKCTILTDPYGIVKIYAFKKDDKFLISDDVNEFSDQEFTLDGEAMKFFFICDYTPSKHTFFKEVSKFEPCYFYVLEKGVLIEEKTYAHLGEAYADKENFLENFEQNISRNIAFYRKNYDQACLFLSGGVDSTFLYRLLCYGNQDKKWFDVLVGKNEGLGQTKPTDGDFDVLFSQRLAKDENKEIEIIPYDFSAPKVVDDFIFLRDHLFTDYAPALGYLGFVRGVNLEKIILNGQNADSILSFGSMGSPFFKGGKIHGLNGFFSRYFNFFGHSFKPTITYLLSRFLRSLFYKKNYPESGVKFTDQEYFLGLGLHPKNQYYFENDPTFAAIENVKEFAQWFDNEYLKPLMKTYGHLSHHALSVLLYQKTYMQGSANRVTVLSSLIQNRKIFLPYTSLSMFEMMCNLKPDWHYAFYGKYPNIKIGRDKVGMPEYILKRSDPVGCDSTILLYTTLINNKTFYNFLHENLQQTDWTRYEGILKREVIQKFKNFTTAISPKDLPTFMRFIWVDSLIRKFKVN